VRRNGSSYDERGGGVDGTGALAGDRTIQCLWASAIRFENCGHDADDAQAGGAVVTRGCNSTHGSS